MLEKEIEKEELRLRKIFWDCEETISERAQKILDGKSIEGDMTAETL